MSIAVDLEKVLDLASRLSIVDKVRLIEAIAPQIEKEIEPHQPKKSLYGLCVDLGEAPSVVEIDEMRSEAWSRILQEDI